MADEQAVEDVVEEIEIEDADKAPIEGVEGEELEDGEAKPLEPWQEVDEEDGDNPAPVKHLKAKKKLRGTIAEQDNEISSLRAEINALKSGRSQQPVEQPANIVRPKEEDFESDDDFNAAMDQFQDKAAESRYARIEAQKSQASAIERNKADLSEAVDSHYERAGKLLESSGISAEVYKNADVAVRKAVEAIAPNSGDMIVDQVIKIMGEGSEKVMYFLGRNKAALAEFQSLLAQDKTGMKAAVYLGKQQQRLTNPIKRTTSAPAPAASAGGGDAPAGKAGAALKKYQAAHAKKDTQGAYNIKKAAKAAGLDVKSW